MNDSKFVREYRYQVIKRKDAEHALLQHELTMLLVLLAKIEGYRVGRGKKELDCVVVESDWPEYEPVWKMIEERMNNEKQ